MNDKLRNQIEESAPFFTKTNKKIAFFILKNSKVQKIQDLSVACNVSLSTVHRFVKMLGYPTWVHFLYEYNEFKIVPGPDKNLKYLEELAQKIATQIGWNKIFISSSRRSKSIAKFMVERLNDAQIANSYLSETKSNYDQFFNDCKNQAVIIFDISGQSYLVQKTYNYLDKITKKDKPQIFIISSSKKKEIVEKTNHVSLGEINNVNYPTQNWLDYNVTMSKIFNFTNLLLKHIFLFKKQKVK